MQNATAIHNCVEQIAQFVQLMTDLIQQVVGAPEKDSQSTIHKLYICAFVDVE